MYALQYSQLGNLGIHDAHKDVHCFYHLSQVGRAYSGDCFWRGQQLSMVLELDEGLRLQISDMAEFGINHLPLLPYRSKYRNI